MDPIEIVQWFFDLDPVAKGFNWPIHVNGMATSKHELDDLIRTKSSAESVLDAYQKFAGAVGPTVMNALLESDDAFPEVNHSGKPTPPSGGKVTLYVDVGGRRVLAEPTKEWGAAPGFSLE